MSEPIREIVVWDLDSTLANTCPRRHLCPTVDPERTWVEYAMACSVDLPIPAAIRLNHMLYDAGYEQHIVSWRSSQAREATLNWLCRHSVLYDRLRLRTPSDSQDSTEFKVGYIDRLKKRGYPVKLVVEDWPATAAAIEAATGVPVLCVNPRYGEAG